MKDSLHFSRRERQIMEVIYTRGEATATDVLGGMSDAPTRTAVRTLLRILETKGHLAHRKEGREFVYRPKRAREKVALPQLRRLLATFFGGSLENAVAAYIADPSVSLSPDEAKRLRALIEQAARKGR